MSVSLVVVQQFGLKTVRLFAAFLVFEFLNKVVEEFRIFELSSKGVSESAEGCEPVDTSTCALHRSADFCNERELD